MSCLVLAVSTIYIILLFLVPGIFTTHIQTLLRVHFLQATATTFPVVLIFRTDKFPKPADILETIFAHTPVTKDMKNKPHGFPVRRPEDGCRFWVWGPYQGPYVNV